MDQGGERWLQGTFDRHALTFGNGPGYTTIRAQRCQRIGVALGRTVTPKSRGGTRFCSTWAEVNGFYTADIARTFPVLRPSTPAQRSVHDFVEKAHRAGLAQAGPGRTFGDSFAAIMEVIATGPHEWSLIDVSVDEALSPDGPLPKGSS